MRRKLERHKKIELAGTADEVLMEEIKEYKVCSFLSFKENHLH